MNKALYDDNENPVVEGRPYETLGRVLNYSMGAGETGGAG